GKVNSSEIVSVDESGGAHTSRTIMLGDLQQLLAAVPADADRDAYRIAVVEDNVLGKGSDSTRKKSYRYLRELYRLDPESELFSTMRALWDRDPAGQPLLAMLCALARDPVLQNTSDVVLATPFGAVFSNQQIKAEVLDRYPNAYSDSIADKIGRNAGSSWTQSQHLEGRINKVRRRAIATPGSTVLALYLGHLQGIRGSLLFTSDWARVLDAPVDELYQHASVASSYGWIDFKRYADVVEVGIRDLATGVGGS
ncbi:MAG: hypothetical protein U9R51_05260, partial [Actinomycetota bacterium]|nr:hypothetical protein [Actinomycetota bacterium]